MPGIDRIDGLVEEGKPLAVLPKYHPRIHGNRPVVALRVAPPFDLCFTEGMALVVARDGP